MFKANENPSSTLEMASAQKSIKGRGAAPDFAAMPPAQSFTARPIKQDKSILKVAVLSEPYFPK